MALAAILILFATVGLALVRPRIGRTRVAHGTAASAGAAATILVGLVPPSEALAILKQLAMPLTTIASLMLITLVVEKAGLLKVIGAWIGSAAGGSGHRLLTLVFSLGALAGSLFTNDAAVLIFTPLVFQLLDRVQDDSWNPENRLPFYFATLYLGNLVGALVISNPINIIVSSFFGIGFAAYAAWMLAPAVVSVVLTYAGLRFVFRDQLPVKCRTPDRVVIPHADRSFMALCSAVLLLTLSAFFSEPVTGLPIWAAALTGAAALFFFHLLRGESARATLRPMGWDVLVFVSGIFIVAAGLRNAGLADHVGAAIQTMAGASSSALRLWTGLVAGGMAAFMNNHPTAALMTWVVQDFSAPALEERLLAFSALIGGDLGPKMLPIGSLAALMWFRLLRDRGVKISYWLYVKIGVPLTLVAIILSIVTLEVEWVLYRWLTGAGP